MFKEILSAVLTVIFRVIFRGVNIHINDQTMTMFTIAYQEILDYDVNVESTNLSALL